MRKRSITIAVLLLLFAVSTFGQAHHYSYKVRYGRMTAGHAHLSFNTSEDLVYSFMNMNSSPLLSTVWSLADTIESTFSDSQGYLLTHSKSVNQGRYHRSYDVWFPDPLLAIVNQDTVHLEAPVNDLPQLLYRLREMKLAPGDTVRTHIWDGNDVGVLELEVREPLIKMDLNPLTREPDLLELRPLQSTSKSRKHGIQVRIQVRQNIPHEPEVIEVDTRYGNLVMVRQR